MRYLVGDGEDKIRAENQGLTARDGVLTSGGKMFKQETQAAWRQMKRSIWQRRPTRRKGIDGSENKTAGED
jgi:hypothetical protein